MIRRKFLADTSYMLLAAGGAAVLPGALFAQGKTAKNTVNIGAIGINGMGWSDLSAMMKHPDVRITALCDVDKNVLDKRVKELADKKISVKAYSDYKKLLADKNVDAVIIGTPDHWHCLIMTEACAAGKDVYVEKPVGNSIAECAAMIAAQQKYNRAVQVGQWQRSHKHFQDAVNFVHSGKLGQVRLVKTWAYMGWMNSIPKKPDGTPPPGVDYAMWLGPAKTRPFNENRFHFNFRWFWDYAGGLMTDWGVHLIDYALLGMKAGLPKSIMASGGKFAYPDDAAETPDTLTTVYEFDGFNLQWEHAQGINNGPYGRDHGIAFIGNNGTLVLDRGGWEVIPEKKDDKDLMEAVPRKNREDDGLELHTRNFVDVVKSRKFDDLKAPIQAGAHVATVAQMGNIAYKTGKKIFWDKEKNVFTDDESNAFLAANYENGYSLPKV
ncbi:MAG: Gfo/Idh/MocA family oxidoreductase [Mucilaginibacter polytrichastri]|nr:Gfo/Idh/MocA family oxidoreductase [Mucilaginibacter polytrichastri]